MSDFTCPRCGGMIPNDETPGVYPGALSRADNETEICSACGTDEAMGQLLDGYLAPVSEWPVERKHEITFSPELLDGMKTMSEHYNKKGYCIPCGEDQHASVEHELDNDGKYVRSICMCCGEVTSE